MSLTSGALVVGLLLITMALSTSLLRRLPLSTSMLYLAAGWLVGPGMLGMLSPDPLRHAAILEKITEIALAISVFATALKLGPRLSDKRWYLPLRLAFLSMMLTTALIAVAGVAGLGLPLGAAVLLGAILAPTDPVLAADVQVEDPADRDRLRFSLSGEAGINDGAAFPFVLLGLGMLGLHPLGTRGSHWLLIDVVWAVVGGLLIGALAGFLVGKLVVYLRTRHEAALGRDEFLTLGLIVLSYATAQLCNTYGLLAVFAAGMALRRIEDAPPALAVAQLESKLRQESGGTESQKEIAVHPVYAPAYMAAEMLGFNEQLERIAEVAVVLTIGAMLSYISVPAGAGWFVPLLFLVVRPASVLLGLLGSKTSRSQRVLIAWFGIRGVGSIYYLMYAINHNIPARIAQQFIDVTVFAVATSIVVHGISVTPLMQRYARTKAPG